MEWKFAIFRSKIHRDLKALVNYNLIQRTVLIVYMAVKYSIASPYFNTIFPSLCIIRLFRGILLQDNHDFSSFSSFKCFLFIILFKNREWF